MFSIFFSCTSGSFLPQLICSDLSRAHAWPLTSLCCPLTSDWQQTSTSASNWLEFVVSADGADLSSCQHTLVHLQHELYSQHQTENLQWHRKQSPPSRFSRFTSIFIDATWMKTKFQQLHRTLRNIKGLPVKHQPHWSRCTGGVSDFYSLNHTASHPPIRRTESKHLSGTWLKFTCWCCVHVVTSTESH